MRNLLNKELRLSTPLLTYVFLAFTLMTFLPGYPILCGAFFVCFGIFQGYQYSREANDIMYSMMLPVSKREVIKAKYLSAFAIELPAFVLFAVCTAVRMTLLADAGPYVHNVLMAANPLFLAFVLMIFAVFNVVFIGGFFKTAYNLIKPFLLFIAAGFAIIGVAETLHHLPGLSFLNDTCGSGLWSQLAALLAAAAVYGIATVSSCRRSQDRFERIDL